MTRGRSASGSALLWLAFGCTAPLTVDRFDDDASSTACVEGVPGDCSLRGAILNANRTAGAATIRVPFGTYHLSIPGRDEDDGETGDLDIADDLTVEGAANAAGQRPEVVTDDTSADRTWHVDPGHAGLSVRLTGLSLFGGSPIVLSAPPWGAFPYGGTIANTGADLTIDDCNVLTGEAIVGGAIYNEGALHVVSSVVSGGGNQLFFIVKGGGIGNGNPITGTPGGEVSIESSSIEGFNVTHYDGYAPPLSGSPAEGAGIYNGAGGTVVMKRSSVADNVLLNASFQEFSCGDGVWGAGVASHGSAWIEDSTLSNNVAAGVCDAARGGGMSSRGDTALVNTTLTGNGAGQGHAVYAVGTTILLHATIAANSSSSSPAGPDLVLGAGGTIELANSLLDDTCEGTGFTSDGGNLESPGNTCSLDQPTDRPAVPDPGLGPLAPNGGPTKTIALLENSPAIDAGFLDACLPNDQRGVPRSDGACDTGAFERATLSSAASR